VNAFIADTTNRSENPDARAVATVILNVGAAPLMISDPLMRKVGDPKKLMLIAIY
jgi:hypothetical protein